MVHPFLSVWNRPNPFMTGRYFREACQQHLDLVGETIFVTVKVGNLIVEFWPVRPDRMQPVKDPEKFLTGWIYSNGGESVPLELDQVIQIKMPNPDDPYRGRGPVQTVLADMDAARYSAEWNKNFFINGAQPGGIIKLDYRMSDAQFNDFVDRWRRQHQGVANAHRVAVLENADWVDTKFSMQDMQFMELRNLPRELIREAFAFPKPMLGTVDDVNRANAEAGKEIMAEGQTIPRLSRWKDSLDNFVLPLFPNGANTEMEFEDPTPVNHEAQDRERVSQSTAVGNLVKAGYDPTDVLEWAGMPDMNWVGIPSPAQPPGTEDEEQEETTGMQSLLGPSWK
jgi:HK97 family phage portal protein